MISTICAISASQNYRKYKCVFYDPTKKSHSTDQYHVKSPGVILIYINGSHIFMMGIHIPGKTVLILKQEPVPVIDDPQAFSIT